MCMSKRDGSRRSRRGIRGSGGVRAIGARKTARGERARLRVRRRYPRTSGDRGFSKGAGDGPARRFSNSAAYETRYAKLLSSPASDQNRNLTQRAQRRKQARKKSRPLAHTGSRAEPRDPVPFARDDGAVTMVSREGALPISKRLGRIATNQNGKQV
jgi:hypothetical protein